MRIIMMMTKIEGDVVPSVKFNTRVRDNTIEGDNPFRWEMKSSWDYFANKRVLVFSLPGAFTPTCSTMQLPGFENNFAEFKSLGIKEIYCLSVNDSFVMNAWAKAQKIKKIKMIPDGSGEFTSEMGMLVHKDNLTFGFRSWRYAMIVNNGTIEKMFVEDGFEHDAEDDPYGESSPENILEYLRGQ